ncbi:4a-hydroxytetrahydrobiopterin dehydratase [Virgibacillus xinjiangensis]|uniref:4a-hydroxytetrahydrobiopterin dehydratase n=1 Tax=Virgibacillus xinjiangensis TaxID=393090 RepID=A0ABV7CX69_9BACI
MDMKWKGLLAYNGADEENEEPTDFGFNWQLKGNMVNKSIQRRSRVERLSEAGITRELKDLPSWKRTDEKWIERKYRFKDYLAGIRFVDQIAAYAEEKKHHPLISIDYKVVTLRMSSWQAKGLTALDFEMAKTFEETFENAET